MRSREHGLRAHNEGINQRDVKNLGQCGRQNMLRPYLKSWFSAVEWRWFPHRAWEDTKWSDFNFCWMWKQNFATQDMLNVEGLHYAAALARLGCERLGFVESHFGICAPLVSLQRIREVLFFTFKFIHMYFSPKSILDKKLMKCEC
jgi:hypothetical protein